MFPTIISSIILLSLSVVIGAMETLSLSELTSLIRRQTESIMLANSYITKVDQLMYWYNNNYRTLDRLMREADDGRETDDAIQTMRNTCSRMKIDLESRIYRLEEEHRLWRTTTTAATAPAPAPPPAPAAAAAAAAAPEAPPPPPTTASEPPTTTASESPTTTASEPPTTTASESPTTTASEPPTTIASESPTTIASEPPTTTASEPPTTTALEPPTTTASLVCPSNFEKISLGCVHVSANEMLPAEGDAYCSGRNSSFYSATSYAELTELRTELVRVFSNFGGFDRWLCVHLIKDTTGDWIWKGTDFVQADLTDTYWVSGYQYSSNECAWLDRFYVYRLFSSSCTHPRQVLCFIRTTEKYIQVLVWPSQPAVTAIPEYYSRVPSKPPVRTTTTTTRPVIYAVAKVPVGADYQFRCIPLESSEDYISQVEISFRRSDGRGLPSTHRVSEGVLYIYDVQSTDGGEYACVSSNRVSGSILYTVYATVQVVGPPSITLAPARQVARPGDHVSLRCIATGDQPITITWSKERGRMPPSVIINGGEMLFQGIRPSDVGKYLCDAVNSAGRASAVAEVAVNGE